VADPARHEFDEHFVVSELIYLDGFDRQRAPGGVEHCGFGAQSVPPPNGHDTRATFYFQTITL